MTLNQNQTKKMAQDTCTNEENNNQLSLADYFLNPANQSMVTANADSSDSNQCDEHNFNNLNNQQNFVKHDDQSLVDDFNYFNL
jgi:hypothetical protein